jgi:hypothetical protein
MTATQIAPTDREIRAEIPSLDELQQRRRELVKEYAPLAAKYKGSRGQGSLADSARKRHRSLIMQKIAIEMRQAFDAGLKPGVIVGTFKEPSESALERMANAHPDHIQFCNDVEDEVRRYIVMENDIDDINEQIQSRQAEIYAYTKELGLQ